MLSSLPKASSWWNSHYGDRRCCSYLLGSARTQEALACEHSTFPGQEHSLGLSHSGLIKKHWSAKPTSAGMPTSSALVFHVLVPGHLYEKGVEQHRMDGQCKCLWWWFFVIHSHISHSPFSSSAALSVLWKNSSGWGLGKFILNWCFHNLIVKCLKGNVCFCKGFNYNILTNSRSQETVGYNLVIHNFMALKNQVNSASRNNCLQVIGKLGGKG